MHAGLATTVVAVVRQHAISVRATGLTQPSLGAGSRAREPGAEGGLEGMEGHMLDCCLL